MTLSALLYFAGTSAALTLSPGPDNLFIVAQGVAQGRRAAIITALGMGSGISIHTTAAALGISALFYSSPFAFNSMKLIGAGYLLFLACKTLRKGSVIQPATADFRPAAGLFRRGFLMNVLNPKVAMFFLAFLPQFVTPPRVAAQMLILGLIFMTETLILFTTIGYFAGALGNRLLARPRLTRFFDWMTACVFTFLGLRLALAQR